MKYLWEAQDVVVGRKIDSHNRAERYMIGYDVELDTEAGNLLLVSLRDGMLAKKGLTAYLMASHLNDAGMRAVCVRLEDMAGSVP